MNSVPPLWASPFINFKMDSENTVCPVCTLFLRPGITLKAHLSSHPKQKVIDALDALVRSNSEEVSKGDVTPQDPLGNKTSSPSSSNSHNQIWNQSNSMSLSSPTPPSFPGLQGNHSFIYQQFMSTSSPQPNVLNVNPLNQPYVTIPTVFAPQMMCSPYVYQQQQVIMSSGPTVQPVMTRPLPIELPSTSISDSLPSGGIITVSNIDDNLRLSNGASTQDKDVIEIDDEKKSDVEKSELGEAAAENLEESDITEDMEMMNEDKNETEVVGTESATQLEEADVVFIEETSIIRNHEDVSQEVYEENYNSQKSNSDWNVKVRTDLNKACQTQSNSNNSPSPCPSEDSLDVFVPADEGDKFYYPADGAVPSSTSTYSGNDYEKKEMESAVAVPPYDQMNLDVDGMQIMFANDFMSGHLISPVEDFESINQQPDRPSILMTIGGIEPNSEYADEGRSDERTARETTIVNIIADERMPARGELSGQESNGGVSDVAWNRMQYHEGSSQMSSGYDLIVRDNWEASDYSDSETTGQSQDPLQCYTPDPNDTPTIVSFTEAPKNFRCSTCGELFTCGKDRQKHVREQHTNADSNLNVIGSQIGKKTVKKLIVKPKKESNLDNTFSNKLKLDIEEGNLEGATPVLEQPTIEVSETKKNLVMTKSETKNVRVICSICDVQLADRRALLTHKLAVHNVSLQIRHKCGTCGEAFPNDFKYTEHLRVHPLECRLCGKLFYRRQNLQLHMKRHLGIRPYKCNICEKSFLTKQKHDEHKNVHTGEAPLKCSLCNETFRRHSNLVQHRNIHHFNIKKKLKDFICFCGEIFHSRKKLAWHKEVHDAKPKSCSQCSEKFIHMSSLTRHMRRAHNALFVPKEERSNENVECPICKGIYLRSSLDVHIRSHSGQRPFTCLICNKDFTTKWNLKLHKWTHAARTSKPFKCDQCNGAFIRETDYVAHMNSHKSVRPYTCNYCGAQFIRKYNCQRHVREHEKGKGFSCQVCGKSFHRSYYLKDHMRIHSGLRPYSCHICGKTSTTKSNHNKHVRIHHAREPISTEN